jgi:hypothetical protein
MTHANLPSNRPQPMAVSRISFENVHERCVGSDVQPQINLIEPSQSFSLLQYVNSKNPVSFAHRDSSNASSSAQVIHKYFTSQPQLPPPPPKYETRLARNLHLFDDKPANVSLRSPADHLTFPSSPLDCPLSERGSKQSISAGRTFIRDEFRTDQLQSSYSSANPHDAALAHESSLAKSCWPRSLRTPIIDTGEEREDPRQRTHRSGGLSLSSRHRPWLVEIDVLFFSPPIFVYLVDRGLLPILFSSTCRSFYAQCLVHVTNDHICLLSTVSSSLNK